MVRLRTAWNYKTHQVVQKSDDILNASAWLQLKDRGASLLSGRRLHALFQRFNKLNFVHKLRAYLQGRLGFLYDRQDTLGEGVNMG